MATGAKVKMTSDDADLARGIKRLERRAQGLEDKFRKVQQAGQQAGKKTESSFKGATGQLAKMGAGFLSVGTAIGVVTAAVRDLQKTERESVARIKETITGRRFLFQISETPEAARGLLGKARRLRTAFGLSQREAFDLTGKAASAGERFVGDRNLDLLGQLPQIAFDPVSAVAGVQKLQGAFGVEGPGGAGTIPQIINKIIAAAGPSPVNASEIAVAASTATASFKKGGGSDEELLALLGTLSEVFKSPLAAGERVKSLADQIDKKRAQIDFKPGQESLGGLDFIDQLRSLEAGGQLKSEAGKELSLGKFLAETNAIQAFTIIEQNREKISRRLGSIQAAEINTGGPLDIARSRIAAAGEDVPSATVLAGAKAREKRLVAEEERFGEVSGLAESLRDQLIGKATATDSTAFLAFRKVLSGLQATFPGADERLLRGFGDQASVELQARIADALERLDMTMDALAPSNPAQEPAPVAGRTEE